MTDPNTPDDKTPTTEELQEPSTEKEPGEEPKAPKPDEPEPSHEATGIGVVDYPDDDVDRSAPSGM
jgi:hypothetical protein